MGQTKYYQMSFFDFGDNLSTPINVKKEIDRFVIIDKQLFGMYKIFGNGVIGDNSFNVTDAGFQESKGISVNISEGIGIINFIAAENQIPGKVFGLPPNSIVDIYATIQGATRLKRTVNFQYSTEILSNAIRLATVSTGSNNILFINNNTRDLIGFEQIIQDAINEHKHRGTPSKIDLAEETRNQLPGARLEGIDTDKVVSGKFDIDRIPLVDHNDLENNGLLTHAALDSFVKTFSQNNKELLGEINSVNFLKMLIFQKYKDSNVDEFFLNEIALLPGISPDSFIDFNASTANISLTDGCISGIPAKTGIFTSVFWNDTFSFNTSTFNSNILVKDDTAFLDASTISTESIADFSDGVMPFEDELLVVDSDQKAIVTVNDGNRIGQLGGGGTLNYFYRLNFSEGKNWDGIYDELVIKVKTTEEIHNPVYMYVVNGSNVNSSGQFGSLEVGDIEGDKKPTSSWEIMEQDENSATFVEKVFDITSLGLTDVTQITIHTDDSFVFEIDDVAVRRTNVVSESGTIRFQYQTEADITFYSVFYDADTPSGTSISVRVKVASTESLLSRASYTFDLISGEVISIDGSAAELEVVMTSDEDRMLTPVLNSIELRLLTTANFTGFEIDDENEWNRGSLSNISLADSVEVGKKVLNISTPINVGGRYFAKSGSVSEINNLDIGLIGFSGNLMPISPTQARDWNINSSRGFGTVTSVVRKFNNNFLITDLENNRILEVDNEGNLILGYGSTYSISNNFSPLTAVYNSIIKTLTIVFTKAAVINDISKISLFVGSSKISLSSEDTVLTSNKSGGKILEILLDDDTVVRLLQANSDNLTVNFETGAFTEDIVVHEGMQSQGNSIFSPLKGLTTFVGNMSYIENIRHPVFISETSDNNWIYGNSSIFYIDIDPEKELENVIIPDLVEINPLDITDTENKLISDSVKFSDYTLGGIYEYSDGLFAVAGIEESSTTLEGITEDELINAHGGPDSASASVLFRGKGITDLQGYAGRIFVLDKASGRKQVLYSSSDGNYPSSIDGGFDNGDLIISESSVSDNSGRITKLDSFGNIVWSHGQGTFNLINSTKRINNDNLIVSV